MSDKAALLAMLREQHVADATFFENGEFSSVRFAPDASAPDADTQHETPAPAVKRPARPVGGLVPRGVDSE